MLCDMFFASEILEYEGQSQVLHPVKNTNNRRIMNNLSKYLGLINSDLCVAGAQLIFVLKFIKY